MPSLIDEWFCNVIPSAGHFRKSVCKLRTQGFDMRIFESIFYRKYLRIWGKKIEIYRNPQSYNIAGIVSLQCQKIRFYGSLYGLIWVDDFIKYNTPLPSSAAV